MEACLQACLQSYITNVYFYNIRITTTNQMISLYQSYATIIVTMSNVWIPQVVGTRQHVPTLKTKVWQFCLNTIIFFSLKNTLNFSGYRKNYYVLLSFVLLYAGLCSILLLHNNRCKKFNQINRLKSSLLTFLFLIKLGFDSFYLYGASYSDSFYPTYYMTTCYIMNVIHSIVTICMDAFFAYIFGKSALKSYSISSIWNLDPTIISKPLLCTGLFVSSLNIVDILFNLISSFVYS